MVIPEPGVSISEASSLASVVLTDIDGRYRLENIPPGRYYVTAGFLDVPTYYPGVAAIGSAKAVNVEPGGTTVGIDFTTAVSAGASVSGRVIFPPGQAIPANLKVSLAGPARPAPEAFLSADGSFTVPRVRPGTYTVRVPPWAATVVVGDADVSGVEIEVPYSVAGTVFVENGGPLPNLSLAFAPVKAGAAAQSVSLWGTGAFSLQLTQGEYRLAVSGLPEGYTLKSIAAGSADLLASPLNVSAANSPVSLKVTLGVASPPPWVKVSGKITGPGFVPDGTRYPAVLTGKNLIAPMNFNAAADGSFELPQVLPGDYTLGVTAPVARSVAVHVGNADVQNIEIAVPTMKEVTARVTFEGQQPGGYTLTQQMTTTVVAGLATRLIVRMGGPVTSFDFSLNDTGGTTVSNAVRQPDGTYRLRLPEGERRVTPSVPGYTVKSVSYGATDLLTDPLLKVSGTDTAQLEVTLALSAQGGPDDVLRSTKANAFDTLLSFSIVQGISNGLTLITGGAPVAPANSTVYLGSDVAEANLLTRVPPVYSAAATAIHEGVVLRADIDKEGTIANLAVVRGHPLLNDAVLEAVKQWRFRPQLVNGQPAAFVTTVNIPAR
jgi:TonB family protein